jgi:carboxypeptidase Q
MRHHLTALLAVLALAALSAQPPRAQENEARVLEQIRREGLDRSQVMQHFDRFVTAIGPRLTGSPEHRAAAEWSRDRLAAWGLTGARLEPFEFGRGWQLERQVVEMIEPRYMPLIAYAEAWSASTKGDIVGTPILAAGRSAEELAAMRDKLAGAIVMTQPMMTGFIKKDRLQPTDHDEPVAIGQPRGPVTGGRQNQAGGRQNPPGGRQNAGGARTVTQTLREAGAGVLLRTSQGEHGTMFVLGRDQAENAMPSIVLAGEHYNMIGRMLQQGVPVKLRINLQTRFLSDTRSYNVLAELPGTDPALKDEVVLIGAHLDSWHSAPGATDNADGSAAVLEAMRILKTIGARPRRTIRVALWGGEEQGLLGARAYVQQHLAGDANRAARERLAVYLNIDSGSGPIYGWYLENSPEARTLFDAWIQPLKDLGVRRNITAGVGSTDHVAFRQAGIPGFNPVQDYVDYDVRTHHTNVDTYERVREQDLEQCAVVMAWFAYRAAMMDEKLPRPAPTAR